MTLKAIGQRIKEARLKRGYTLAEMGEKIGVSEGTFSRYENGHVDAIKTKNIEHIADILNVEPGWIMGWQGDESGGPSSWKPIPIYGTIAAGLPLLAEEQIEGYEYINVERAGDFFFLRVKGDSMINARINNGDLALIRKQTFAENDQIVAVLIDGIEATLKRYHPTEEGIWFLPENPSHKPLFIPSEQIEKDPSYVRILGVLVKLIVPFE